MEEVDGLICLGISGHEVCFVTFVQLSFFYRVAGAIFDCNRCGMAVVVVALVVVVVVVLVVLVVLVVVVVVLVIVSINPVLMLPPLLLPEFRMHRNQ